MTPAAVTAFSLAYAVAMLKHHKDGTKPPPAVDHVAKAVQAAACMARINRVPASNPGHPRHLRKGAYSARQWRICTRKSHDLRMFGASA